MARFRIEIQITLLTLIIAVAVVTSGYLVYKSLSEIVSSIHQAARPDNKLFLIKDIATDLSEVENNVRLYVLTNQGQDIEPYRLLQKSVSDNLQSLVNETVTNDKEKILIDSIISVSFQKLEIWEGVLQLHESARRLEPAFTDIYSKLEEKKIDTLKVEHKKKGVFRWIFGTKKVEIDTTLVARELKKEEIKQEIQNLEIDIWQKGQQFNFLESRLMENNLAVDEKLNNLIIQFEKNESDKLINKTNEADRLASITYKRLAAFSVTAVILLLLVLSLLYNYVRKTRKYQRMLTKAKTEAEGLARAKEQFAANVSHEIRTPINAIYGLSEQLLQKEMSESAREQLIVLSRSASHLKNIVNDTLDFSKIQANKLKFDSVHFSLAEVFNEIIAIQRSEAREKGLDLKFETVGTITDILVGDPLRLKQILLNLISNSLKFTDSGYILLQVETVREKDEVVRLKMIVKDSGIGISKENQFVIFEEYVQAEQPTAKKYGGTGLGLSIVKKLVEFQGGKISIESEKGSGTMIFIELPFKEGNPEMIQENKLVLLTIPDSFKNLSVLVADDEEFNRFLLKGIFEKWGIAYQEVANGSEAVDYSLRNQFDMILMDLNMPGKNGIDATIEILREKPETKIIAITASNDKADLNTCIKAGMVGFLAKPFSEADLFNILVKNLELNIEPGIESRTTTVTPEINFDELKRLANYDEAFFIEMLEIFIRSSEKGMAEIEKEYELKNLQAVADAAHKMAAPSKHIGAKKLHALLIELEKCAGNEFHEKDMLGLIINIRKQVSSANLFIREFLNTGPTAEENN